MELFLLKDLLQLQIERVKLNKELKANHKLVKTIGKKKSIYFSAGHFIGFNSRQNRKLNELEKYLKTSD